MSTFQGSLKNEGREPERPAKRRRLSRDCPQYTGHPINKPGIAGTTTTTKMPVALSPKLPHSTTPTATAATIKWDAGGDVVMGELPDPTSSASDTTISYQEYSESEPLAPAEETTPAPAAETSKTLPQPTTHQHHSQLTSTHTTRQSTAKSREERAKSGHQRVHGG
ncbi:hypothetical protein H072_914 [Dactylellina haptotyla CBS 200.50]|uniref:Uncharacterized protein n=1 Tax=Dactylellina haptotyla (strain CBS 200.50) TaxID=1284197 RepID=S8C062_DACHA|nr:hypothetical protein H072_914 [Dactylellina haptotyla CBS 200.50]